MLLRGTPKEELERRVKKFQEVLKRQGIDGAMIIQNVDVFYFAGTMQRSHLFIPAEGQPVLMVKRSYLRACEESAWENIVHLASPKDIPAVLQSHGYGPFAVLGFELDVLPFAQYQRYQKLFANTRIADVSGIICALRMIKSPYELALIEKSARLNQEIYTLIKEHLREGITELDLAGALEAACRQRGHMGMHRLRGFNQELGYGHLMSGTNLAVSSYFDGPTGGPGPDPSFPQSAGFKLIGRNEPVLVDYGFVHQGYIVDQTRIFCLGKLPDHLVRAYAVARDIQERIKALAKPGVTCAEIYQLALETAEASGFGEHFMGYPERVSFVGHGVGLELDELPVLAKGVQTPLAEGMVLAIEPKFVFPDGAVGIENTHFVTADGLKTVSIFDEDIIYI